MFKKKPHTKASSNIKSSERRRLFAEICKTYDLNQAEITKEDELAILPATTKQASFKTALGQSGTIFFDEREIPVWFQTRDSQVFPSLFTLWKYASLLPIIKTHPHVIEIIANGADLMLPGTVPPFDVRATKGKIVAIADTENPTVPKAIGRCKLNLKDYTRVIGMKGIAADIIHCIDDELCNLNDLIDIPVPEELEIKIPEPPREQEAQLLEEGDVQKLNSIPADIKNDEKSNTLEDESKETNGLSNTSSKEEENIASNIDDIAELVGQLDVSDVDRFYERSLLQTLQQDSIELPITASLFMSNHIYKNLPIIDLQYCNIKKTSWKKTSKFLKAMEKLKYLKTKGKGEDLSIVELTPKDNPTVLNFVPHRTVGSSSKSTSHAKKQPGSGTLQKSGALTIVHIYKPRSVTKPFFSDVNELFDNYYQPQEIKTLLNNYVKLKNLTNPNNKSQVVLNDTLKSITGLNLGSHPRDVISKAFMKAFSPNYVILKPGEQLEDSGIHIFKGEPPSVNIITEVRIGRKVVTRVSNFEHFYIKPPILADELKVKCSGSSTIGPCKQDPKLTEVTVQGPHGKTIIELLKTKGVPVSYIKFEDKTKKKK